MKPHNQIKSNNNKEQQIKTINLQLHLLLYNSHKLQIKYLISSNKWVFQKQLLLKREELN